MYVEYDSVRDFFFLAPPAFLGAFADFLEGVLAILLFCVSDVLELGRQRSLPKRRSHYFLKATNRVGTLNFIFRPPLRVPLISLDQ